MMTPSLLLADLVSVLETAGEPTRLRLLLLLRQAELTVSELTTILGQSQPRVSRHLKLLLDAGLIQRHREGAWAFFRARIDGAAAAVVATLLDTVETDDPTLRADRARLDEIRTDRAAGAAEYFARHAVEWDRIRALHVSEARVEAAILAALGEDPLGDVLDLGTGTGRMLELLAPRARRTVGVDVSPAMLAVARANLERAGLGSVQLRQADAYALPPDARGFDVIIIHQVLHFLDDPARAVREAARALKPGGRLLIVDFAPHDVEDLRLAHAHRRLGFGAAEIGAYLAAAGLEGEAERHLAPGPDEAARLTVSIFVGRDQSRLSDFPFPSTTREVA